MAGVARAGRWLLYPALMSVGIGVLASCGENPPAMRPRVLAVSPRSEPAPLPTPPRRAFPVPAHKPVPPPPDNATPADATAVAMAAPEEPALSAPEPLAGPKAGELVGLDEGAATRLLGTATEQSTQPPATVWRYRNQSCELDLFFYLDLRSGKMRALHYAFKGDTADPDGQQQCLRSLVIARGN